MQVPWRKTAFSEKGFTLFEVVVAGFVAILFFLLVLQATSLNSISHDQAQEAREVLGWLQKDVEVIKHTANTLQLSTVSNASQGSKNLYLANPDDESKFDQGDIIEFINPNPDGVRYTIKKISNAKSGYLQLASKLSQTYPPNSMIHVVSQPVATLTLTAPAGSNVVNLSDVKKIKTGDEVMFGGAAILSASGISESSVEIDVAQENYKVKQVLGNAIALNRNLAVGLDYTNSINVSPCNTTNKYAGFGDALRDELMGIDESTDSSTLVLDSSTTKTSNGKQYTVKRMMELVDIPPYNLLQIRYDTYPKLPSGVSLDSFVNRILPDVVFYCN